MKRFIVSGALALASGWSFPVAASQPEPASEPAAAPVIDVAPPEPSAQSAQPDVPAAPAQPAAPATAPAAPEEKPRILRFVVNDLTADGVPKRVARVVTESVVVEMRKLRRIAVVSMGEVREVLEMEARKQLLGCSSESCLADISDLLGVDGMVVGTLRKISGSHVFSLKRIDQRTSSVVGAAEFRLKAGNGEEFLAAVGPAVEKLFKEQDLRPNTKRGVAREMAARLNPPPLPRWAMVLPVSAVALGIGLGLGLGAIAALAMADYQLYAWRGRSQVIDGRSLMAKGWVSLAFAAAANLAYAVAFVGGISGLITAWFVDWNDYRSLEDAP